MYAHGTLKVYTIVNGSIARVVVTGTALGAHKPDI